MAFYDDTSQFYDAIMRELDAAHGDGAGAMELLLIRSVTSRWTSESFVVQLKLEIPADTALMEALRLPANDAGEYEYELDYGRAGAKMPRKASESIRAAVTQLYQRHGLPKPL